MKSFVEYHLSGFDPSKIKGLALEKLMAAWERPITPNAGQASSPVLMPSYDPMIAASAFGLTPEHQKGSKEFIASALRWWWNYDATLESDPQPFATYPDGKEMINSSGNKIVPKKVSLLHLSLVPYLGIWELYGEKLPLLMAADFVEFLRATYAPLGAVESVTNTRQLRVLIDAARDWYAATGDTVLLLAAARAVVSIRAQMGTEFGVPFLTKNKAQALHDDHGDCDVCTWQTLPDGDAVEKFDEVIPLNEDALAVVKQARECAEYALAVGLAQSPPVFMPADYSTEGKPPHIEPKNAMLRFCYPMMVKAGGLLRAAAFDDYAKSDWSNPIDNNFGSLHNLSLNLFMLSHA